MKYVLESLVHNPGCVTPSWIYLTKDFLDLTLVMIVIKGVKEYKSQIKKILGQIYPRWRHTAGIVHQRLQDVFHDRVVCDFFDKKSLFLLFVVRNSKNIRLCDRKHS